MKKRILAARKPAVFLLAAVLIVTVFFTALTNIGSDKAEEDRQQLEKALSNAAVSCYAIEGSYPPSVEYLVENYGIQIDTERFAVKYERYASNLMPDITVLVNNHENENKNH